MNFGRFVKVVRVVIKSCCFFSFFFSAFAGDVKKGIPTDEELEDLSDNIPDHWKKLTFDKAELEAFDKDNDKIADKAYAMLMVWKQREGSVATYRVLNKALCDIRVKRRDLAQRFCCN